MLAKILFKLGQRFRNPSLSSWYLFLKNSEKWTLDELKAYQLEKLQALIAVAYANSEFYKSSFQKAGIKPSAIKSLNDLKKLPIVTKQDLLHEKQNIQQTVKSTKYFNASTSGTTGASLIFKRAETTDSFNRASLHRGYSWYNVKPWDRNGYFWGFNLSKKAQFKTRFLDFLQNRFRLFNFNDKELRTFAKKLNNSVYLHGYSSAIYETAKQINSQHLKKPVRLKMVKGTSEKIFESYQNEIKQAFGQKIISEYGAVETGIIAFECPKGVMHLNMEGVIVEEIANEIVVTNLQLHSFPIIRYKLGDFIKLAPETKKCECGMRHLILEEVTGRVGAMVYGKTGSYPSLYFYYIFKNLAKKGVLLTYQVIQENKGKLLFLIEQNLRTKEKKVLIGEIKLYFKEDMEIKIKDGSVLTTGNQKQQSFISKID
jgi:phenylacetate-CoA ligase